MLADSERPHVVDECPFKEDTDSDGYSHVNNTQSSLSPTAADEEIQDFQNEMDTSREDVDKEECLSIPRPPDHFPAQWRVMLTIPICQTQVCLWRSFSIRHPSYPPPSYRIGEHFYPEVWWQSQKSQDFGHSMWQFLQKIRKAIVGCAHDKGLDYEKMTEEILNRSLRLTVRHMRQDIFENADDLNDFTLYDWLTLLRNKKGLGKSNKVPLNVFINIRVEFDVSQTLPDIQNTLEKLLLVKDDGHQVQTIDNNKTSDRYGQMESVSSKLGPFELKTLFQSKEFAKVWEFQCEDTEFDVESCEESNSSTHGTPTSIHSSFKADSSSSTDTSYKTCKPTCALSTLGNPTETSDVTSMAQSNISAEQK
ncbi:uncharacterized protein L203_105855 [Cryptococcus depauperatus CBS 7841]|uniref:Uncharacterized protein n=1 Tax=Cryptococcus depauperatus CBS 7841 TaxID=1295531 RepID=A0A1E3I9M0_9TREE|nr:hypothetical protein L203_05009 [Cryptococcus depauperatus CBS 7841]